MSATPITDSAKRTMAGYADEWVPRYVSEELERECAVLRRWKEEMLTVNQWWQEVDDKVRLHPHTRIGDSVSATTLRFIEERDEAREGWRLALEGWNEARRLIHDVMRERNDEKSARIDTERHLEVSRALSRELIDRLAETMKECDLWRAEAERWRSVKEGGAQ